jgi:hypothetical protein
VWQPIRKFGVAGLRFSIGRPPAALAEVLDRYISLGDQADSSCVDISCEERVRFEEGPKAATRVAEELVVHAVASDIEAGLRGALVLALDSRRAALLHGAGVVIRGQAVLCVAPSEGGKTTLCRKIRGRAPVLSDETVALWLDDDAPRLAGTFFWSGEPLSTAQGRFPLAAICFLNKGGEALAPIVRAEALQGLLSEWHLPDRSQAAADALALASSVLGRVPIYRLQTRLDTDPLPLLSAAVGPGR